VADAHRHQGRRGEHDRRQDDGIAGSEQLDHRLDAVGPLGGEGDPSVEEDVQRFGRFALAQELGAPGQVADQRPGQDAVEGVPVERGEQG
jgi:hypothetical protein